MGAIRGLPALRIIPFLLSADGWVRWSLWAAALASFILPQLLLNLGEATCVEHPFISIQVGRAYVGKPTSPIGFPRRTRYPLKLALLPKYMLSVYVLDVDGVKSPDVRPFLSVFFSAARCAILLRSGRSATKGANTSACCKQERGGQLSALSSEASGWVDWTCSLWPWESGTRSERPENPRILLKYVH